MRIREPKEHGLGHLLNPTDPTNRDRGWIERIWEMIVEEDFGRGHEDAEWFDGIAASRLTASSPYVLEAFRNFNKDLLYANQVKPFNFLLSVKVAELGHPIGYGPKDVTKFHLVAPWERDAKKWKELRWFDVHSGNRFSITTDDVFDPDGTARVQTYRDVFNAYGSHGEPKSLAPESKPCAPPVEES